MAASNGLLAEENTVEKIFDSLSYGSAVDSDSAAKTWLDDYSRQFGHFINNEWYKPDDGNYVQIINPSTGGVLSSVREATESDVETAAQAARAAYGTWSTLSDNARSRHLYSLARHIQKHQQLFSVVETLDTGRCLRESRDTEVPQAVRLLYHFTGWAQLCSSELQGFKPYGVVAIVPSFSRPLVSLLQRLAAALATGNTVVVCPPFATPLSALLFAEICKEAGLPAGVVNVVTEGRECGAMRKLVLREEVDKVAYAGTTREGQMLRQLMAGSGKNLSLELSGRSTMLVFDSADLDSAVEGVVDAGWGYAGQLNSSASRVLVQESVSGRFTEKLKQRLQKLLVADSMEKNCDVASLTSSLQVEEVKNAVEEAQREGAEIYQVNIGERSGGCFYPPTLVVGAQTASRIVYEEFLAPVVCLMPFRTAKEAAAIANNSPLAVAASVWTEDISLALEMAYELQAGTVWINSHGFTDAAAGSGGPKQSGSGRVGSRRGLLEYVRPSWMEKMRQRSRSINYGTFGSIAPPRPFDGPISSISGGDASPRRVDQTFKLYYGGVQKRPDGQYSRPVIGASGSLLGHVSEASRKDVRNAVEVAVKAAADWSKKAGHLRAQILYYIAENLEVQKSNMSKLLDAMTGLGLEEGRMEVDLSIERLFYWAAYCDKYGGSVQEVPMGGTVFEMNESVGVVGVACPDSQPLLAFVSLFAAAICRGNAVIMIPSEKHPLAAVQMYQVFDTSDVPGGVINILTGNRDHLTRVLAEHHDVQALWYFGSPEGSRFVEHASAENLKRTWVCNGQERDFCDPVQGCGEEFLFQATQPKTVWAPAGEIFAN